MQSATLQQTRRPWARGGRTVTAMLAAVVAGLAPTAVAALTYDDPTAVKSLAGAWRFHAGDSLVFGRPELDDLDWSLRHLPTRRTRWSDRWRGLGWYRLHVHVAQPVATSDLMLALGPARQVVQVYVNGALVGERGAFGGRLEGDTTGSALLAMLPRGVLRAGDNVLALRLFDPTWSGGLSAGPLLLGPPHEVRARLGNGHRWTVTLRLALAVLALVLGLALLVVHVGGRSQPEHWLLAGAGLALALYLQEDTGVLSRVLGNLELAVRLPTVGAFCAVLCIAGYFSSRYGDLQSRPKQIGTTILLLLIAVMLLAPDSVVFSAAKPLLFFITLGTTLYAAHLLSQAARRQEREAIPVFLGLLGVLALLVLDVLGTFDTQMMPPLVAMGAVGFLALTVAQTGRGAAAEHDETFRQLQQIRRHAANRPVIGVLEAATLALHRRHRFLDAVIHEVARDLAVRRCSLVLERADGRLHIRAAIGLPRHAMSAPTAQGGSVASWVFENGTPLTAETLPKELQRTSAHRNYVTKAFVAMPVRADGRTLGVLNLTDRNDGGEFSDDDKQRVHRFAHQIGEVLQRTGAVGEDAFVDAEASVAAADGPEPQAPTAPKEIGADSTQPCPANAAQGPAAQINPAGQAPAAAVAEGTSEPTGATSSRGGADPAPGS